MLRFLTPLLPAYPFVFAYIYSTSYYCPSVIHGSVKCIFLTFILLNCVLVSNSQEGLSITGYLTRSASQLLGVFTKQLRQRLPATRLSVCAHWRLASHRKDLRANWYWWRSLKFVDLLNSTKVGQKLNMLFMTTITFMATLVTNFTVSFCWPTVVHYTALLHSC